MHRVKNIETKPDHSRSVTFEDGTKLEINLSDRLFGPMFEPMFEPLKDPAYFAPASVDAFGVICWPNGAVLAPDACYDKLKAA